MSYSPFNETRYQYLSRVQKVGYSLNSGLINVALSAETDFLLFKNTPASGKLVEIYEQVVSIPDSANTVRSIIRIYKNPTITSNGVAITIGAKRNGQAPSICTAFTAPVISARGTMVQIYNINYQTTLRNLDLARYVEDGDSILFTVQPSGTNIPHSLTQAWAEVPT